MHSFRSHVLYVSLSIMQSIILWRNFTVNFHTVASVAHANKNFIQLFAALFRHNQPGVSTFLVGNGYAGSKDALGSYDAGLKCYFV